MFSAPGQAPDLFEEVLHEHDLAVARIGAANHHEALAVGKDVVRRAPAMNFSTLHL